MNRSNRRSLPQNPVLERAVGETEARPLSPSDPKSQTARAAYGLGLAVLKSARGRSSLRALGRRLVEALRDDGVRCLHPTSDRNLDLVNQKVDDFLRKLETSPPELVLYADTPGEASTRRYDWPQSRRDTVDNWQPSTAGFIVLNSTAIHQMSQERGSRYNTYMFVMAISVAHEIGHFLTGFFAGNRPKTPPVVTAPGVSGEAGFFWEMRALGGIIDVVADPRDPNNPDQPGIPYLFPDASRTARGSRISQSYIDKFVNYPEDIEVPMEVVRGGEMSRKQLEEITEFLTSLRQRLATGRASSASSPASTRDRYIHREERSTQPRYQTSQRPPPVQYAYSDRYARPEPRPEPRPVHRPVPEQRPRPNQHYYRDPNYDYYDPRYSRRSGH